MNNISKCKNGYKFHNQRGHKQGRKGPSSYFMHDSEQVFNELKVKSGNVFLDLGCGAGDYSIQASKIVGDSGLVYAVDIWEEVLDRLKEEAVSKGLRNIQTKISDMKDKISIEDNCIDICFIATVLHSLDLEKDGEKLFREIHRVLKSDGRMAIIECKKEDAPFGPPKNRRLSSEELEQLIKPYGFKKISYVDLGYNYMIQFSAQ